MKKRLLSIVLAAMMVAGLTACGGSASDQSEKSTEAAGKKNIKGCYGVWICAV